MTKNFFGFDDKILKLAKEAENSIDVTETNRIKEYNSEKVLHAFIENRVSEQCFCGSSGYGYGDIGRDVLDKVYAQAFGTEDALVRHNFVSGTHALSTALWGILRKGDKMLSVTGSPYDTLEEVIGIKGNQGDGSLIDFGIDDDKLELLEDGTPDIENIRKKAKGGKLV